MMLDTMTFVDKLVTLYTHNIDTDVREERLYASEVTCKDGVASSHWIDVTDWSRAELFAWLGY